MKHLLQYISESIKELPNNKTGLIVFDIDDTLLKADDSTIKIYKKEPGKEEISLTTDEYAKDPDSADLSKRSWYNYRDFEDPNKVYKSIIKGTPLIKNLRIMDAYLDAGYKFCFLTARGCEDIIKDALDNFLKTKNKNGELKELGNIFNKVLSHAINDVTKHYNGTTDADKKANILVDLCSKYDQVVFVDDDNKNIQSAKNLNLPNLKVIKAWEE